MCTQPIYLHKLNQFVPCRKCSECRMSRSIEWAVRCYFEAKSHFDNCFITLTFDDVSNPEILDKKYLQDFFKRFRKAISPVKIKYFACGEYGPKTLRPHFHIVVFGYNFSDRKYHSMSEKGYPIYVSDELSKLWKFGYHTIEDVSFNTAVYTALYSAKSYKKLPYPLCDFPEFNLMSQGIGIEEIAKKIEVYLETDEIFIDGHSYKIPNAVLNKLFVDYEYSVEFSEKYNGYYYTENRIVDERYTKVKEDRKRKFAERYPTAYNILNNFCKKAKEYETFQKYNRFLDLADTLEYVNYWEYQQTLDDREKRKLLRGTSQSI